jgi:hypothetical protein
MPQVTDVPSMASTASAIRAAAPMRAGSTPAASATGPATICPTGMAMNDPTMSYEYTRASFSGGMCSCMVVSQATPNCSNPSPAANTATNSTPTWGATPSATIGRANSVRQAVPKNSIRWSRIRIATNAPRIMPMVCAASTKPQARRPIVASATVGPRTLNPPLQLALRMQAQATTTHSHVRDRNSLQPVNRSARMLRRSSTICWGTHCWGTRRNAKQIPASTNAAASTMIPQPGPTVATTMPAAGAPMTAAALKKSRFSALACCRSSTGTVCGRIADDAGIANAPTRPLTPDSERERDRRECVAEHVHRPADQQQPERGVFTLRPPSGTSRSTCWSGRFRGCAVAARRHVARGPPGRPVP